MAESSDGVTFLEWFAKLLGPAGLIFGAGAIAKASRIAQRVEDLEEVVDPSVTLENHAVRLTSLEKTRDEHGAKLDQIVRSVDRMENLQAQAKEDRSSILSKLDTLVSRGDRHDT